MTFFISAGDVKKSGNAERLTAGGTCIRIKVFPFTVNAFGKTKTSHQVGVFEGWGSIPLQVQVQSSCPANSFICCTRGGIKAFFKHPRL